MDFTISPRKGHGRGRYGIKAKTFLIGKKGDAAQSRLRLVAEKLITDQKRTSFVEVVRKQVQPVSLHTR
jgi:hypothetical protein